jgi:hypothetical protein
MNRGWLAGLFLFLALAASCTTARAGTLNGLGRYFGWGWSEGYHARNECKPYWCAPPVFYAPGVYHVPPQIPLEYAPAAGGAESGTHVAPLLPSRYARPQPQPLRR